MCFGILERGQHYSKKGLGSAVCMFFESDRSRWLVCWLGAYMNPT